MFQRQLVTFTAARLVFRNACRRTMGGPKGRRRLEQGFLGAEHFLTPEGKLTFEDGISAPGRYVEMVAERDVIALISNCPQLNNPCNGYNPTPVQVLIWN